MNAEQIKASDDPSESDDSQKSLLCDAAFWLKEIAFQLAVMNERYGLPKSSCDCHVPYGRPVGSVKTCPDCRRVWLRQEHAWVPVGYGLREDDPE